MITHIRCFIFCLIVVVSTTYLWGAPEMSTSVSLEASIGQVAKLRVTPHTVVFPHRRRYGAFFNVTRWQTVAFLAGVSTCHGPRDLYCADVKLNKDGHAYAVRNVRNLTQSNAGDEYDIISSPPYVAVPTRALGQVRAINIFEFDWQSADPEEAWTPITRFLARMTNLINDGTLGGIGRTIVRFLRPADNIDLILNNEEQTMTVAFEASLNPPRRDTISLLSKQEEDTPDFTVTHKMRLPKRPILWLVDTVRSLNAVGPGPVAWTERQVYDIRSRVDMLMHVFWPTAKADDLDEPPLADFESRVVPPLERLTMPSQKRFIWPPEPIAPPVFNEAASRFEGRWRPSTWTKLRRLPGAASSIYRTFIRLDAEDPDARVYLFAMDMRQLELHMVGGMEDPESTTGSSGRGRIPRRPNLMKRIVAAFNGGFKTAHGEFGMMVEGDILVPPVDGAATVATMQNGQVLMGAWPGNAVIPPKMVSLRQNLEPLLKRGQINPNNRSCWGVVVNDDLSGMKTVRSGLCRHPGGYLIYVWGRALTARDLGRAMKIAGCDFGMHLDMNPYHTVFAYFRFPDDVDVDSLRFDAEIAIRKLIYSPERYVYRSPKDFFFVALKTSGQTGQWQSDGLVQPSPALPATLQEKQTERGYFMRIDLDRVRLNIRENRIPSRFLPKEAASPWADGRFLLTEVDLGPWSTARGQIENGIVVGRPQRGAATLMIRHDGGLQIGAWSEKKHRQAVRDMIHGTWLTAAVEPEIPIVAVGIKQKRLWIGTGRWEDVADEFTKQGISNAVAFLRPPAAPLVRRTVDGTLPPVESRADELSPDSNILEIEAAPISAGVGRLADAFSKN